LDLNHRHQPADDGRKLHETVGLATGWLERHDAGAEGHLLILDLPDPLARTDRLIVDRNAGRFLVVLGPFGVDRIGKGGAGAGNLRADGGGGGNAGDGGEQTDRGDPAKELQELPPVRSRRKGEPNACATFDLPADPPFAFRFVASPPRPSYGSTTAP